MHHFRSFNRFILIGLALLGLSVSSAHAALVTGLQNVDIDGTLYDVTFHSRATTRFNQLWAVNGAGSVVLGGTLFDGAPAFWGNVTAADAAAAAILLEYESLDLSSTFYGIGGSFYIPYALVSGFPVYSTKHLVVDIVHCGTSVDPLCIVDPNSDTTPWASFAVSAVPVPAAVWLFGTALIGLVGFSKRKSGIAA
jgi:hypothetical protein